ncbi:FKBP-type peptidyl-prolyl cis-trans isomerase [Deinococcus roseus]|uniref:Peptidyl-prolyl cis-trans isomerase n=1 Tax=Deinococcus roseus TaxID=392414 RepID=A0ABQ2D434_9DEIO|nr:peptidylprolyl isomerase [Deinococcus roseus]GGJ45539.1 peptidyl-prolyl cis-trans isomerase [Deinococcus roseus]
MSKDLSIAANKVVELDYVLTIDGDVIDKTEPGEPLLYLHGAGNLIPGLEKELEGKVVGDALSVTIDPADAYGEWDEQAIEVFSAENFEGGVEVGATYYAENPDGTMMPFTVVEVRDDQIVADFNHPLAGQTLHFEVKVVNIREATEEELDHGHPHGADGTEVHDED